MIEYDAFLSFEATTYLRSLKRKEQDRIATFISYLKISPFEEGDSCTENNDRTLFIKGVNKHMVIYYADHANKEIRVTSIKHISEA